LSKSGKNLLPRRVFERVALYQSLSKIKPGFPKKVVWLTISLLTFLSFAGYYPTFSFPPIKEKVIYAQVKEQKGEVIASSFSEPINLPHPGYLSTKFSSYHPGIDIASGLGMPIHPITDGTVEEVGRDIFGLGNYLVVSHENGFKSKYAHLGKIYVKKDQQVKKDNTLGEVGMSGNTSGPHTHLEVTRNGEFVDPQRLLPEISDMPKK
jgi:murein DD-endopeptidase MepM/ murein hydrolase activator NlpD